MGSTQIINHTSKPLDMKVGNCRHFTKVATVDTNKSYTVHSNYDDTYMEYTLGVDNGEGALSVIVSSDECVDHQRIIIREVNGKYDVKMEPRSSHHLTSANKSRWKFWER